MIAGYAANAQMPLQVGVGTTPNDHTGDPLRTAFIKHNTNVTAIYDSLDILRSLIGSGGGDGTWGSITGTLSNQTDLQTALNAKAPTVSPTFTVSASLPAGTSIGTVSSTEIANIDGSTSNIQAQLNDTTTLDFGINARTASYTLALSDNYKLVTMSSASALTLTVPPNSAVAFPIGANITIVGINTGQVTIAAGSGVTINSAASALKLRLQYSTATLIKTAENTWLLMGDISS